MAGKRIFITGATGHVGSVVTEFAVAEGYQVRALSRAEKGDIKLKELGATPVRGDLGSHDVLRAEASQADIVFHLADSFLDFANPKEYSEVIQIDGGAVDALASGVKGTDKPLVVTSGTLVVAPANGAETTESSPIDPQPFVERIKAEEHATSWADKGVKLITIRLAPFVYGRGRSGVFLFMQGAVQGKAAVYVGDGHWPSSTVHVDDAARLYLLAATQARAGDIFNATNATDLTTKKLAEALGVELNVPPVSLTEEQASAAMGPFMAKFLTAENRASSAKAKRSLGWQPREKTLLDDISTGSYHEVAQQLLKGAA